MAFNLNIQYLTDQNGGKTAVLIPMRAWMEISQKLEEYKEIMKIKTSLSTAFQEVVDIEKGKIEGISPEEFLEEL